DKHPVTFLAPDVSRRRGVPMRRMRYLLVSLAALASVLWAGAANWPHPSSTRERGVPGDPRLPHLPRPRAPAPRLRWRTLSWTCRPANAASSGWEARCSAPGPTVRTLAPRSTDPASGSGPRSPRGRSCPTRTRWRSRATSSSRIAPPGDTPPPGLDDLGSQDLELGHGTPQLVGQSARVPCPEDLDELAEVPQDLLRTRVEPGPQPLAHLAVVLEDRPRVVHLVRRGDPQHGPVLFSEAGEVGALALAPGRLRTLVGVREPVDDAGHAVPEPAPDLLERRPPALVLGAVV